VTAVPPAHGAGAAGRLRSRDSNATKKALLDAAQVLFGEKGFEATTLRDIGRSAGVDAALIARYFGSKADLYIAAVVAETQNDQSPLTFDRWGQVADYMLQRVDAHGPGPVLQALIRSDTANEIRQAAQAHLARRLIEPMVAAADGGSARARLRGEVVVAALVGISLGRSLGWFGELTSVQRDVLVELLGAIFDTEG
jgi:AcrR family transcriptional regulator